MSTDTPVQVTDGLLMWVLGPRCYLYQGLTSWWIYFHLPRPAAPYWLTHAGELTSDATGPIVFPSREAAEHALALYQLTHGG